MRAASSAQRAMIMPVMWEAIGALCVIFIDLGEFEAARSLVDAIMPQASRMRMGEEVFKKKKKLTFVILQVLEGWNTTSIAQLYSILTDAHVGLAGKKSPSESKESSECMDAAFIYLDRAHEGMYILPCLGSIRLLTHHDIAYIKMEDLDGTLESLMKKAMLYKHRDDEDMVEEMERLYTSTVQEAERRSQGRDG
jgi:anaphase-promoting complex subunit 5